MNDRARLNISQKVYPAKSSPWANPNEPAFENKEKKWN